MPRRAEFYFDGTYYRKRIKLPDGRWKDVRARTKEELRSKLYDMETAQRMGLVLDGEATVAELAVEWYTNRSAGLSAARQGDYRIAINHHCPVIGAMRVRDVKPEHCQRVMAQAAELSNSAQQKIVSTMKQLFSCAVDNGLTLRAPHPGAVRPAGGGGEGHAGVYFRHAGALCRPAPGGDLRPPLAGHRPAVHAPQADGKSRHASDGQQGGVSRAAEVEGGAPDHPPASGAGPGASG